MKRISLRREAPKRHRVRNAVIAAGAVGATTAGIRHWRSRGQGSEHTAG